MENLLDEKFGEYTLEEINRIIDQNGWIDDSDFSNDIFKIIDTIKKRWVIEQDKELEGLSDEEISDIVYYEYPTFEGFDYEYVKEILRKEYKNIAGFVGDIYYSFYVPWNSPYKELEDILDTEEEDID